MMRQYRWTTIHAVAQTRTGWIRGMQDSGGQSDYVWGRSSNNSEGLQIKICMIYWFGTIWSRLRLVELNLYSRILFSIWPRTYLLKLNQLASEFISQRGIKLAEEVKNGSREINREL